MKQLMKSTPQQAARRQELKRLVEELGELAWKDKPAIASAGVHTSTAAHCKPGVLDFDEVYVLEHAISAIPAVQTNGKVLLRFRRRVTRDGKNSMLWHIWEPGYAATKPEAVDELLPVLRERVARLRGCSVEEIAAEHPPAAKPLQVPLDQLPFGESERQALAMAMFQSHIINERVFACHPASGETVEVIPGGATFEVRVYGAKKQGIPTRLCFVRAESAKAACQIVGAQLCEERATTQWRGMMSAFRVGT